MSGTNGNQARWRGWLFYWVNILYLTLIYGVPTATVVWLLHIAGGLGWLCAVLLPGLWTMASVTIAGVLSIPHQFSVQPGKFRRDVCDRLYFHRRVYGLCWTALYYNKPVYFVCLSVPFLKWMTFRLFGYRGSMKFTVYPDTWIRDLPLLHFEDGVYVSNRATLGTNIVLSNGFLLVDQITLGAKSLVGHLAMIAPGVEMESGAEVAVGGGIGIRARLGAKSFVGPCSVIEHGVRLGAHAAVGAHSYIGSGSVIPDEMRLPAGSIIAPRTRIIVSKPEMKEEYLVAQAGD